LIFQLFLETWTHQIYIVYFTPLFLTIFNLLSWCTFDPLYLFFIISKCTVNLLYSTLFMNHIRCTFIPLYPTLLILRPSLSFIWYCSCNFWYPHTRETKSIRHTRTSSTYTAMFKYTEATMYITSLWCTNIVLHTARTTNLNWNCISWQNCVFFTSMITIT
jgi:hypothetical protein